MALDKTTLQSTLTTILSDLSAGKTVASCAADLATAIDTYVKSATVIVTSVSLVTAGTAASGPGSGTLS